MEQLNATDLEALARFLTESQAILSHYCAATIATRPNYRTHQGRNQAARIVKWSQALADETKRQEAERAELSRPIAPDEARARERRHTSRRGRAQEKVADLVREATLRLASGAIVSTLRPAVQQRDHLRPLIGRLADLYNQAQRSTVSTAQADVVQRFLPWAFGAIEKAQAAGEITTELATIVRTAIAGTPAEDVDLRDPEIRAELRLDDPPTLEAIGVLGRLNASVHVVALSPIDGSPSRFDPIDPIPPRELPELREGMDITVAGASYLILAVTPATVPGAREDLSLLSAEKELRHGRRMDDGSFIIQPAGQLPESFGGEVPTGGG